MTRKAFTLIELMFAVLMFSVVIISISGVFSAGVKAWRAGAENKDFQKIRTALLRVQKELRGSFFFSGIPFKGTSSEIIFPITEEGNRIYKVNYYVLENVRGGFYAFMKRKFVFTDNGISEEQAPDEFMFSASSINFEYARKLKNGIADIEWKSSWEESDGKIPLMVKINFRLGTEENIYHKIIIISHEK